ncbi:MAG: protoporphyrinogen oxidase, partial [Acidimicrobiales bacterium]
MSRRLGDEVARNVVDPLLGGIYATDIDQLSARATFPQIEDATRRGRSLMLSLRKMQKQNPVDPSAPIFGSLNGGLGRLIDTLQERIIANGGEIRLSAPVLRVETTPMGSTVVDLDDERINAGNVVLTTPAFVTAELLRGDAQKRLSAIEYSSVVLATMDLAANSTDKLTGSGLLVAKSSQDLITAVSYGSNKWPAWVRDGGSTLRVSGGHIGNPTVMEMTDGEILAAFSHELEELVGLTQTPTAVRISRWNNAFPQYDVGHQRLVKSIREDLKRIHPAVLLTGAAYDGI